VRRDERGREEERGYGEEGGREGYGKEGGREGIWGGGRKGGDMGRRKGM